MSYERITSQFKEPQKYDYDLTSTSAVYSRIPALSESKIPPTMLLVVEPGLYDVRMPKPAAIPIGVVHPYRIAPANGTQDL